MLNDLPCLEGTPDHVFPPTESALGYPRGLLAWGGSLTPGRLLEAYRRGIFPWYSEGEPVLWWSPSPRCVLYPAKIHVSKRTRRRLRRGEFEITADTAFSEVMKGCAQPGQGRETTWITAQMHAAYQALHELGHAHSVEAWQGGKLAGGVYGVSIGRMFFGESMFSNVTDASKVALATLCQQLTTWGYGPMDCQVENPHLLSLGAEEIDRAEFENKLKIFTSKPGPEGDWSQVFDGAWKRPV